jgi:tetratricopeptide (TPR) repeat protein
MVFDAAAYINQIRSKSLNDVLDQLEIDLSHIGQGNEESAYKILLKLDYAYQEIAEITQKDLPIKAEAAQFAYLVSGMEKNAKAFLRDMGGSGKLVQLRQANSPRKEQSWWYLDEHQRQKLNQSIRVTALTGAIIVGVLLILIVIYRTFLMPDPNVSAAYSHQMNAVQAISQNDFEKALAETSLALSFTPDDSSLLIMRAGLEQKLGMTDLSVPDFAAAEKKLGSGEAFLLTRSQMWLQVGEIQASMADAQAAIQMNPNSAEGYFILGRAYQMGQSISAAEQAFTKASDLAGAQGKTELQGTIRVTLAMLLQSMPVDFTATPQITPSPK